MSITAANTIIMLSVPQVFPIPQQIQGFATDDVFDIPSIRSVEVMMGVDGILTGGFVFSQVPQRIQLMADSASNSFFDTWWAQMKGTIGTYPAQGQVRLPDLGSKYTLVKGFLTSYKPAPTARRVLQPRDYEITWETVTPSPM